MSVLGIARSALTMATSAGVGAIVTNLIKATTPENTKVTSKILVGIGGLGLSFMLSEFVDDYVSDKLSGISITINKKTEDAEVEAADADGTDTEEEA